MKPRAPLQAEPERDAEDEHESILGHPAQAVQERKDFVEIDGH